MTNTKTLLKKTLRCLLVLCLSAALGAPGAFAAETASEWRNPDYDSSGRLGVDYEELARRQAFKKGQSYLKGDDFVEKDYEKAAQWFRKAADLGHAGAQNQLGYMYAEGLGVAQDWNRAKELFRKSAAQGDETAKDNLAIIEQRQMEQRQQQSGGGSVRQDNSKWFGLAAAALGMVALSDHLDKNKARRDAYKAEQAAAYARNPSCHERCEADNQTCLAVGGDSYQCYRAKEHCKRSCN